MRFPQHIIRRLLLAAAFGAAAGCSGSGPYPVEGMVVWEDGTPAKELASAQIVFDLPERQTSARGSVQPDGTFQLTTNKANDGALPGKYKVMILEIGRKTMPNDPTMLAPTVMDIRYSDPRTTDLEATIEPVKPNKITLRVKRNSAKK
ncbi:MAG: hypothetical protein U0746_12085 [Gemmataceae bacterium]